MKTAVTMTQVVAIRKNSLQALSVKFSDYLQLTKFKLSSLVVITTGLGYLIALRNPLTAVSDHFLLTMFGSFLVVGAANAFNQVLERGTDALMVRTKNRPLPSRRMGLTEALLAGTAMTLLGLTILAWITNWLTTMLAALALTNYVFGYTPLKRRSEFCTLVGAISGAIPPMMGWAAVRNELSLEAWALFALQFLWQLPHFWTIAWLYREDYLLGGFKILPVKGEPNSVTRQTMFYTFATVVVSIYPLLTGKVTPVYALIASLLGAWFVFSALRFHSLKTKESAKKLLIVADSYLPLILLAWLLTKQN